MRGLSKFLTIAVALAAIVALDHSARAGPVYEWQYSVDGSAAGGTAHGKTWIDLPPTTGAQTSIHNLTPGCAVSFRHCVLTKAGVSDWGDPVTTLVV